MGLLNRKRTGDNPEPEQKYYNNEAILKTDCEYMLQLGERSNGKSYADKLYLLRCAWDEKDPYTGEPLPEYEFAYIRRWDLEIKGKDVEQYFADMVVNGKGEEVIKEITGGEYETVAVYQRRIYFAKVDPETGSLIRGKLIGHCFAITQETHYKSLAFPKVGRAIFEEFITNSGYLEKEPQRLLALISTIFRRRRGRIFLVGNTISRACPYFGDWGLSGVLRQDKGTICIYNQETDQIDPDGMQIVVRIAVEFCENSGHNSKMFFGQSAKMITSGDWESEVQPHLEYFYEEYRRITDMIFELDGLAYRAQLLYDPEERPLVYIYPLNKIPDDERRKKRIISDNYSLNVNQTRGWVDKRFRYDRIYMTLLSAGKYAFSDNLTGTEFLLSARNHALI